MRESGCAPGISLIVAVSWDGDQSMYSLIHERQSAVQSALLERRPSHLIEHVTDAASIMVAAGNEPSGSPLDLFDVFYIAGLVRVPN